MEPRGVSLAASSEGVNQSIWAESQADSDIAKYLHCHTHTDTQMKGGIH